jgi:hypothetical protein
MIVRRGYETALRGIMRFEEVEVPTNLGSVSEEDWSEPLCVLFLCYIVVYLPTYLLPVTYSAIHLNI